MLLQHPSSGYHAVLTNAANSRTLPCITCHLDPSEGASCALTAACVPPAPGLHGSLQPACVACCVYAVTVCLYMLSQYVSSHAALWSAENSRAPPSNGSLHECSCYALTAAWMPPALLQPLVAPECVQVWLGKVLSQTSHVQARLTGQTHQHSCWRKFRSPRSHMMVMSHRTLWNQPQLRTCQGTEQHGPRGG